MPRRTLLSMMNGGVKYITSLRAGARQSCRMVVKCLGMTTQPCVYILTNATKRVLYVGVTSNLAKRIFEHRSGAVSGFTQKYHIREIVYVEWFDTMEEAIKREKQLKAGSREKKLRLIESANPTWSDLYPLINS